MLHNGAAFSYRNPFRPAHTLKHTSHPSRSLDILPRLTPNCLHSTATTPTIGSMTRCRYNTLRAIGFVLLVAYSKTFINSCMCWRSRRAPINLLGPTIKLWRRWASGEMGNVCLPAGRQRSWQPQQLVMYFHVCSPQAAGDMLKC